jgi:hypothetical protein
MRFLLPSSLIILFATTFAAKSPTLQPHLYIPPLLNNATQRWTIGSRGSATFCFRAPRRWEFDSAVLPPNEANYRIEVQRQRPRGVFHRRIPLPINAIYNAHQIRALLNQISLLPLSSPLRTTYAAYFVGDVNADAVYQQAGQCIRHFSSLKHASTTDQDDDDEMKDRIVLINVDIPKRLRRWHWLMPNKEARTYFRMHFVDRKHPKRLVLASVEHTEDESGKLSLPIRIYSKTK